LTLTANASARSDLCPLSALTPRSPILTSGLTVTHRPSRLGCTRSCIAPTACAHACTLLSLSLSGVASSSFMHVSSSHKHNISIIWRTILGLVRCVYGHGDGPRGAQLCSQIAVYHFPSPVLSCATLPRLARAASSRIGISSASHCTTAEAVHDAKRCRSTSTRAPSLHSSHAPDATTPSFAAKGASTRVDSMLSTPASSRRCPHQCSACPQRDGDGLRLACVLHARGDTLHSDRHRVLERPHVALVRRRAQPQHGLALDGVQRQQVRPAEGE